MFEMAICGWIYTKEKDIVEDFWVREDVGQE